MARTVPGPSARAPRPESWDEARDIRRFWWLLPPATFAVLVWLAVLANGGLPGSGLDAAHERSAQRFTVGEAARLEIDVEAGEVTVEAAEVDAIEVEVERVGYGDSKAEARLNLERMNGEFQVVGSTVHFEAASEGLVMGRAKTDVRVRAPAGTELEIFTGAGDVRIDGIDAAITVVTTGDIDVAVPRDASLDLWVRSTSLYSDFPLSSAPPAEGLEFHEIVGAGNPRELRLESPLGKVRLFAGSLP
jgi:hypothetical protein